MGVASLPRREELAPEQRWDIESVFPTDAAWEAALAEASGGLGELAAYRGRLGESASLLLEALFGGTKLHHSVLIDHLVTELVAGSVKLIIREKAFITLVVIEV